jgi:hypothetical protein
VPAPTRGAVRADYPARAALDAVARGERRLALGLLADALRAYPYALAHPRTASRIALAVGALATGGPGRRLLTRVRLSRARRFGSTRPVLARLRARDRPDRR